MRPRARRKRGQTLWTIVNELGPGFEFLQERREKFLLCGQLSVLALIYISVVASEVITKAMLQ